MIKETDARAVLNGARIDYWLSVGAQPSENVHVLIKKYGTNGSHLAAQAEALEKLKVRPAPPPAVPIPLPKKEEPAAATPADAAESASEEVAAEPQPEATPAEESAEKSE